MQHLWRDLIVGRKMFLERFQADFEPLLLENIREAALWANDDAEASGRPRNRSS
jgi:hypothetical protein